MHTPKTNNEPNAVHTQMPQAKSGGNTPFFQPKLTMNQPGDEYEREADAVADRVMRMTAAPSLGGSQGEDNPVGRPLLQRKPIALTPFFPPAAKTLHRKCAECEKEEPEGVQRKESAAPLSSPQWGETADSTTPPPGGQGGAAPPIVSDVLSSGSGQPIDGDTRQFMESRFGQDFSQVRIHVSDRAAESAEAIQARAYTSGRDVVFGKGEYQPSSDSGKRLLAHELVHVGQQGGGGIPYIQRDFDWGRGGIGAAIGAGGGALLGAGIGALAGGAVGAGIGAGIGLVAGGIGGLLIGGLTRDSYRMNCGEAIGGEADFPITIYYGRNPTNESRRKVQEEVSEARSVLERCCLNLVVNYNNRVLAGNATFNPGSLRPDNTWQYPAAAVNLGAGNSFSDSIGLPVLIVDDVPQTGGGVTVISSADPNYHGRTYAVVAINQGASNEKCNTLAHELWHVIGNLNHESSQGGEIASCDSNALNENYCRDIRNYVVPVGDFPTPSERRSVTV